MGKSSNDSILKVQKPLLSENQYHYINVTDLDTITRNVFLWYPLKITEDIFNYLPGYYLKYMDVGQVQNLSYNQSDFYNMAVLRHGRPVNDLLDGSMDFNLLSRNEISEIELTNGFGNFLYNYNNGINIIDRQIFQNRPFSEISYWQDRFENLDFDGSYHQNIFKYFNFNFGITKHSYDGKYTNSDFDKWLGRFNLNYIGSKKFNAFLNTNYSKIQRGLNEGININTVASLEKETLFDETDAVVKNPDAYEIRERFDVDLGFILASGKKLVPEGFKGGNDFLTKLQFFTSNSFRKYRDEENRLTPNGIFVKDNSHWIDYGVKLQQTFKLKFSKWIELISLTEAEYNKDLIHTNLSTLSESERIFFIENLDLITEYLSITAYGKAYKLNYADNKFYSDFGFKSTFKYDINKSSLLKLSASYSNTNKLPNYQQYFIHGYPLLKEIENFQFDLYLSHKYGFLMAEYYQNDNGYNFGIGNRKYNGINAKTLFKISVIDFEINYQHNFPGSPVSTSTTLPENSGNILLSYHDVLFKNKLELKTGFTTRFWSDYYAEFYNGFYNSFYPYYQDSSGTKTLKILANASLDFFIIGKISRAVFGLTFENMLNRLYYTTGVYPNQERGGMINIISRFNITWYFLN